MKLVDLSNELIRIGFPDMFDFKMDGDILDIQNMKGSLADTDGDIIVEFKITELDEENNFLYSEVEITNYPNLGYLQQDFILTKLKNKMYADELTNEDYEDIKTFGEQCEDYKNTYKLFDKYLVLEHNGVYIYNTLNEIDDEEEA